MVPLIKSERGYIMQLPLKQLLSVKNACECYSLELSKDLLRFRFAPEAEQEIRDEVVDLQNIAKSIERNIEILENFPEDEDLPLDILENDDSMAL